MLQQKNVFDLLKEVAMFGCKPFYTLFKMNHKQSEANDNTLVD